jgi:hypothetical protein
MAESTVLLILLSALLVGLVVTRLFKNKSSRCSSNSGTFTIPDDCTHLEIQMIGGGGGGGGSVATPEDHAMIGLSQQIEQDMYSEEKDKDCDASCPYCPKDDTDGIDFELPVDVPLKAKPRKKKASKKKASKKKSKKSPKRKK